MSIIALIQRANPASLNDPLETNLDKLIVYGKPRFQYMGKGWYCAMDMNTSGVAGVEFKVSSEFDMPSANAAAVQCLSRAQDAVSRAAGMAK